MTSLQLTSSGNIDRLPPALVGLVKRPKRLSAQKLWNALEKSEKSAALESFVRRPEDRRKLVGIVADRRNFRENTISCWENSKIIRCAQLLKLANPLAKRLLREMHVERRREMLAHFLNALGVPNNDGVLVASTGERGFKTRDLEETAVHDAANDLAEEHGLRRVVVYFLTLAMDGVPFVDHLLSWMDGLSQPAEPDAQTDLAIVSQDEDEEAESENDPARHRSFTTLDRLLVYALVDSKQGVVGSLDEDEIDDAVEEFVSLNRARQHSHFHLGLRDVLFGRSPGKALAAPNRKRERWYWAGAIQGWARLESWADIVTAYDANAIIRSLGDGADFATDAAAGHVIRALRHEGRSGEVADFGKVEGLTSSPALFQEMLNTGTRLLRSGDAADARNTFDRLMEVVRILEEREQGFAPAYRPFLTVRRRRAHCLQRLLEHDRARRLLEDLLDLDPDPNHLAMVHADLGLLAGRFNSLEDVCLPREKEELLDHIDRLREGREHFRRSVENDVEYAAHGHYCLGVLALGENVLAPGEAKYGDAADHFVRARAQFRRRPKSYHDTLVNRTDLYLGISRAAHAGSSEDLAHAARVMVRALRAGALFPPYLVGPAVEGIDLGAGAEDVSDLARALLDTFGPSAVDVLAKCEKALEHCGEVVSQLRERARRRGDSEPAAADLRACLTNYCKTQKREDAGEALDCLQALAMQRIGLDEFMQLLSDKRNYELVWTPEDADIAMAQCHEVKGNYQAALDRLRGLFHQYASAPERADALGVLDTIRGYGLPEKDYASETGRADALWDPPAGKEPETSEAEPDVSSKSASILFVGGAEPQKRVEAAVRKRVEDRAPKVEMTFVYSGWSGNWKQYLDRVHAELPKHDAVVVLRLIRTELGKQVRKACGKTPWRSCWQGQRSMTDAILAAAEAAWEAG